MQVLFIVIAVILAVALMGFIVWNEIQARRREKAGDLLHREVLEMEAAERERVLREILIRGEDLIQRIQRLEVTLRVDGAAWEAEASRQILQGPEKAESSGIVLDSPIPKE